jgi:hypothetical protein
MSISKGKKRRDSRQPMIENTTDKQLVGQLAVHHGTRTKKKALSTNVKYIKSK